MNITLENRKWLDDFNLNHPLVIAGPCSAETEEQMRAVHRQAKDLFEQLRAQGLPLDTLSMGMTADVEIAVEEGSTLVRVGTALFGQRPHSI